MNGKKLSNGYVSGFCMELSLLLHAGVELGDGLHLLAEEEPEGDSKELLKSMAEMMDQGDTLATAIGKTERFPEYVTGLVTVGEYAGRTEEALGALSRYYENRERLDRRVRSALLYPAVLFLLMLAVIVVLLVKVLPVFDDVYASLGGRLTGVAGGLLVLGRILDAAMPVLCVLMVIVVCLLAAFAAGGPFQEKMLSLWRQKMGDRGVSRALNTARLAQALAMGLRSGLPMEEALSLAASFQRDVPAAEKRCRDCREQLENGVALAKALNDTGVLPASACRMLAMGQKGGSGDTVMEELARRLSETAEEELEAKVGRVEPALVLISSVLVGVILLSVMLPLMHIMTAIG